jgi:hypothetical protein
VFPFAQANHYVHAVLGPYLTSIFAVFAHTLRTFMPENAERDDGRRVRLQVLDVLTNVHEETRLQSFVWRQQFIPNNTERLLLMLL